MRRWVFCASISARSTSSRRNSRPIGLPTSNCPYGETNHSERPRRSAIASTIEYLKAEHGPEEWAKGMRPEIPERETLNNPVYTGRFTALAGLDLVHVPAANMPGGDGTNAWLLDTKNLGFIATESLGGGYVAAGDLVESKTIRLDEVDGWRLRARCNFAAAVTDPGAGYKLTGVSS